MGQSQQLFDWVVSHWAFCAFVIGMIFEIPQLKQKPFTRVFNWMGKRMTHDLSVKIESLHHDVDDLKSEVNVVKEENEKQMRVIDMNDANFIRTTILSFANSLRQGQDHTQEEYDHIIDLNDQYEKYVSDYDIRNGRFAQAYRYILACYSECLEGGHDRIFLA